MKAMEHPVGSLLILERADLPYSRGEWESHLLRIRGVGDADDHSANHVEVTTKGLAARGRYGDRLHLGGDGDSVDNICGGGRCG